MRLRGVFDSGRVHQLQGSQIGKPWGAFPFGATPVAISAIAAKAASDARNSILST